MVRPFFVPMINNYDWTDEQHPCFPSSLIIEPSHVPVIQANMDKAVEAGAQTFFGYFVEKLIMEDGRCTGCYARNAETGKYVKATASKGVVLATGDYGSNPDIISYYCPEVIENNITEMWMNFDVEGNPTNTGDGLKLGAWAGAAIQQHHAPMIHHMGNCPDGSQGPLGIDPYLRLNKAGQRFMNEDCPGQQTENQIENCQDHTCYMIWDANWQEQMASFPAAHGPEVRRHAGDHRRRRRGRSGLQGRHARGPVRPGRDRRRGRAGFRRALQRARRRRQGRGLRQEGLPPVRP